MIAGENTSISVCSCCPTRLGHYNDGYGTPALPLVVALGMQEESDDARRVSGTVTDADRRYFRELGQANKIAHHGDGPANSLAEALRRMAQIDRSMGIDTALVAAECWPDRDSHLAYVAAIEKMVARERRSAVGQEP